MPVDYNILARVPSVGSRFVSGMEAGREAAIRNQLLQRQQMQFEQAQQDRAMQMQERQRQMQQAQQQEAIFQQAADLIRKSGLDPDDPAVLQQFTAAAVQSRNPQLISLAGQMSEQAQKRAQERAYRTEYEQMFGGPQGAAPMAAPGVAPMAAPPPLRLETTIIDEGRARPEAVKPPVLGAQPSPVTPPASVTTQPLSTGQPRMNALAPAVAPVNAMTAPVDPFAAQRAQAMAAANSPNPMIANRGKLMLQQLPRMAMPEGAGRPISVSPGATLMSPTGQILGTAPPAAATPEQRERLRLDQERVRLEGLRADIDQQRIRAQESRDAATQKRAEEAALRAEKQLAQAEKRLSMAEEQARRAADPEFQARITAARTEAQLTAKDDMAALSQGPAAVEGGTRSLALLNRMVGDPKAKGAAAQPHPGFTGTVGMTFVPGARFVPGTPEADFQGMLDQIKGGAFLEAYERLKGTGQITEIEGKKATDAITRMGTAISENEFMQAAKELRDVIQSGIDRTNARINKAQGRQRGGAAPAAPATADADAQAREWLRQNPTHPRAAEIRRALGE